MTAAYGQGPVTPDPPTTPPPPPPPPTPRYVPGQPTATCPITWPGHSGCAKAPTPHSVHRCSCGAVHIHSLAQPADQPLTSGTPHIYSTSGVAGVLADWLARSEPRLTITGSAS